MFGSGTIERGHRQQRTIALLRAFAALAEYASAKPSSVRLTVLWLLLAAEAVARDYAIKTARDFGYRLELPAPTFAQHLPSPNEALGLALRFDELADVFEVLFDLLGTAEADVPGPFRETLARSLERRLYPLVQAFAFLSAWSQVAPDTS